MRKNMETSYREHITDFFERNKLKLGAGVLAALTLVTGCAADSTEAKPQPQARPTIDFGGSQPGKDETQPHPTDGQNKNTRKNRDNIHRQCGPIPPPNPWVGGGETAYYKTGCTDKDVRRILIDDFGFEEKEVGFTVILPGAKFVDQSNRVVGNTDDLLSGDLKLGKDECDVSAYGNVIVGQERELSFTWYKKDGKKTGIKSNNAETVRKKILPDCT